MFIILYNLYLYSCDNKVSSRDSLLSTWFYNRTPTIWVCWYLTCVKPNTVLPTKSMECLTDLIQERKSEFCFKNSKKSSVYGKHGILMETQENGKLVDLSNEKAKPWNQV